MIQTFAVGDHARMFTSGLCEAFGTARGLSHLLSQCGIVTEVAQDAIVLDMGEYGLVRCSKKNAYQTMPAGGFEDMPDFLPPWEDEPTTATAPAGIPTVKEELDRKLGDTLDWLLGKHKQGGISDEALSCATDALFMATSGLANEELTTVMTAVGSYLPSNKPAYQTRVFRNGAKLLIARWRPGESEVRFLTELADRKTSYDSPQDALNAFKNLHVKFGERGYVEEK